MSGDGFLLRQALVNLLDNALDFAPAGSCVEVHAAPHAEGICIEVRDRGPGVPEFARARVFERFYSLPRPDGGSRSSGLGLPFVAQVAPLHGGRAELLEREGGGSVARLVRGNRLTSPPLHRRHRVRAHPRASIDAKPASVAGGSGAMGSVRLGVKIAVVLVLVLAILVPLSMIRGTIAERQRYRAQAVEAVTRSFAGAQGIAGPVLVVPYREQVEVEERDAQGVLHKQQRVVERQWQFFPKTMRMTGKVLPSVRERGLHKVRVYELQAGIDAGFDVRLPEADPAHPRSIGTPWLDVGIKDVRGLVGTPVLKVGTSAVAIAQGQLGRSGGGVHAMLPAAIVAGGRIAFPAQAGFRGARHRGIGDRAIGRQQPHRAGLALAASAVQRRLPAAFAPDRRRRLPCRVGGLVAGQQCAGRSTARAAACRRAVMPRSDRRRLPARPSALQAASMRWDCRWSNR